MLTKAYLQRFYTTEKPGWVQFCEKFLNEGFVVFLYLSNTNSKYVTLVKNNKMMKIRFSKHSPNYNTWLKSDVKFCVGPKFMGMNSESEVYDAIQLYFG